MIPNEDKLFKLIGKNIISILLICIAYYFTLRHNVNFKNTAFFIIGISTYMWLSYRIVIYPDYDDMGLFGGLIDNPLRITDNFNRFLSTLQLLLIPGKYMADTLVETIEYLRYGI